MHHWLVWNVLFPLHERLKGHPTLGILKEMEAADRLSARELEQLRGEKLRQFIHYCHAHVPYVRSLLDHAGLKPADVGEPRDLALLPTMTKAKMREHREGLRSD